MTSDEHRITNLSHEAFKNLPEIEGFLAGGNLRSPFDGHRRERDHG